MKSNPYYRANHFGLEIIKEVSYSVLDSEFDIRVIWKNKTTGELFTARSFGYVFEESIFQDLKDINDLEIIDSFVLDKLKEEAQEYNETYLLKFLESLNV